MDLERWQRLEELYHAALDLEPAYRASFLDEACHEDEDLRREVKAMLVGAEVAGPMDQPPWMPAGLADHVPELEFPPLTEAKFVEGALFGRYRIIRLVAEGGMGAVYEAEQENPRRTVALKLIKPGLASQELMHRFKRETVALGRLQHPGIAQIYEAGAADAGFGPQPYFAMEFIRGKSLHRYADTHKLTTSQRLEIMAKVCDAVHHAHQRGLIHRDLKPANILVDQTGQPKVLDFGVARITDIEGPATRQTDLGQLVGTLAYMSPEQVLADPLELDTRSDVYSLGVVLYELLAGELPYRLSRKLHEAAEAIRSEEPARLSSVNRRYSGDIETIVAKALDKDKSRRYSSAADMASDIRRYLSHEPIVARPPTTGYQLRKFAQRHRGLVAGVAAVIVTLAAGLAVSTWQAVRADRAGRSAIVERDRAAAAGRAAAEERDRATAERNRAVAAETAMLQERDRAVAEQRRADTESQTAKAVNEFLRQDLLAQASVREQARPDNRPDPDLKVRTALDRAAARIGDRFKQQPLVEAALRQTIGSTYQNLGSYREAQREKERAVEIRRRVLGENHPETLASLSDITVLYQRQGKDREAVSILTRTIEAQRRILGPSHPDTLESEYRLALAYRGLSQYYKQSEALFLKVLDFDRRTRGKEHVHTRRVMFDLAELYRYQGRFAEAEPLDLESLALNRRLLGNEHPQTLDSVSGLAATYRNQGKYAQAEPLYIEAVEVRKRLLGEEHRDTLAVTNNLVVFYTTEGRYREAVSIEAKVVEVGRRVLGEEHPDVLTFSHQLAFLNLQLGEVSHAEAMFDRVLQLRRRVLGEEHRFTLTSASALAGVYRHQGKYQQATPLLEKTLEALRRTLGDSHPNTWAATVERAALYRDEGKLSEAEALLAKALEVQRSAAGERHPNTLVTAGALGDIYIQEGKTDQAEPLLRETLRSYEATGPTSWRRWFSQCLLGESMATGSPRADAEPLLVSCYTGLLQAESTIAWPDRATVGRAADRIARLLDQWGDREKSAIWKRQFSRDPAADSIAKQ